MKPLEFMAPFGQELARIIAGHPDLPKAAALRLCLDLQKRHAGFVLDVLKRSVVEHAEALSQQSLPTTCLLLLHVSGGSTATVLPTDPRKLQSNVSKETTASEQDILPDLNRPLEVSFIGNGAGAIVIVRDLCRVVGKPALVAHLLKRPFEEDRAAKRPRDQHRFISTGDIASQILTGKDAVAQNVKRCRSTIAEAFETVHGRVPEKDMLIQAAKGQGYRIDPDVRIVAPDA